MPVTIIRIGSDRKFKGYGEPCFQCQKPILDTEYVARTKTRGTAYYHSVCAQSIRLIDSLVFGLFNSPFRTNGKESRVLSRGLRKKFVFFSK